MSQGKVLKVSGPLVVASGMEEAVSRYTDSKLPAIIPIPNKDGSLGIGMASVKKSVERAVGADILFGGE